MTRRELVAFVLVMLGVCVVGLVAQTTPRIGWDQAATSATVAQGWTYRFYLDGAASGTVLAGVTCAGASAPFLCSAPFPTLTPGQHTLQLTAAATAVSESVKSDLLFVNTPAPQNPRLQ